jgi:hypothetical protein
MMAVAGTTTTSAVEWERLWAPYDEPTYQAVLAQIEPEDIVLEIGAGDLRLAYQLARRARLVYAIEISRSLATIAPAIPSPDNLQTYGRPSGRVQLILADAYRHPFPQGITVGVLLMRHCQNFREFADKLVAVGCRRLITNARWGLGVELVDLLAPRTPYASVSIGWYACWCGATGFVPGHPEQLTPELEATAYEVVNCPACTN